MGRLSAASCRPGLPWLWRRMPRTGRGRSATGLGTPAGEETWEGTAVPGGGAWPGRCGKAGWPHRTGAPELPRDQGQFAPQGPTTLPRRRCRSQWTLERAGSPLPGEKGALEPTSLQTLGSSGLHRRGAEQGEAEEGQAGHVASRSCWEGRNEPLFI